MATVRISGTQRCIDCGKFIADQNLPISKLHYEPLNEFGPEVIEWHCHRCSPAQASPPAARSSTSSVAEADVMRGD